MSAPALDPGQLARLLPLEAAEAAIAELQAQGLSKQAEAMQKALDAKRAELAAAAKANADAEEKARQEAIAEAQREFDEAHAEYEAARDANLERLVEFVARIDEASELAAAMFQPANRLVSLGVQHAPVVSAAQVIAKPGDDNIYLRAAVQRVHVWANEHQPVMPERR
jgi:hypothetical protein